MSARVSTRYVTWTSPLLFFDACLPSLVPLYPSLDSLLLPRRAEIRSGLLHRPRPLLELCLAAVWVPPHPHVPQIHLLSLCPLLHHCSFFKANYPLNRPFVVMWTQVSNAIWISQCQKWVHFCIFIRLIIVSFKSILSGAVQQNFQQITRTFHRICQPVMGIVAISYVWLSSTSDVVRLTEELF